MNNPTVTVMMTCFNRIQYTVPCVKTLAEGNLEVSFHFIVTDDGSTDNTGETLKKLPYTLTLLSGNGQLFWNGGMEKALGYALTQAEETDYYLLVNDDVTFFEHAIEKLIARQRDAEKHLEGVLAQNVVIAGSTADADGGTSYGGVKLLSKHFARFAVMEPSEEYRECDTFNGNCVLIPRDVFFRAGNVDGSYRHSMSDYDYGMKLGRLGVRIYNSAEHVGRCNDNDVTGSWRDRTLKRRDRIRKKESPKGLPRKDWYHFIRKNYGFFPAIYHSITPYIRILLKK